MATAYIMTHDSAIEQRAIRLAFPGPIAGEPEVAHLLCSVHSNGTLLWRLGSNANKPEYINSSNMRCTVIQG